MEGFHDFAGRVEGQRDPHYLLALGVFVLFDIVDLLVGAPLHHESEHALRRLLHFAVPFFVLVHADLVNAIHQLQHQEDSLAIDPLTFEQGAGSDFLAAECVNVIVRGRG